MLSDPQPSRSGIGDFLLQVCGTVQGVGFRPFIARLANEHRLSGWVRNDHRGVTIRIAANREQAEAFAQAVQAGLPPAAMINSITVESVTTTHPEAALPDQEDLFSILESPVSAVAPVAQVTPDLALCGDCRRELMDPTNRRYHYPFINCTNCGPRYSIVRELPYDRQRTTMAGFTMCSACRTEYEDVGDRRYHAQPNACPDCGPRIDLTDTIGRTLAAGDNALQQAVEALQSGRIVAVKGLGGFHLMVDATDSTAVDRLRERKHRDTKPLAVMFRDRAQLEQFADVTDAESDLLSSAASPIVLVRKHRDCALASSIAPDNPWIGALLPYTPLHVMILAATDRPLVATSGNLSDEPICTDNADALARLGGIADLFLMHDRPIERAVDDSVQRIGSSGPILLRRARGYAPTPLLLPKGTLAAEPILSVGGHLKNTVAVTMANQVILSPHIGDLGNVPSISAFRNTVNLLSSLYGGDIRSVACDLHPDYASTRFAESLGLPVIRVQHHLAHILACLLEHNGGPDKVLGISWDGTGYGPDGTIWGGEFILVDRKARTSRRLAHLRPFPLPGGESAIRRTGRCALGALHASGLMESSPCRSRLQAAMGPDNDRIATLVTALERRINAPLTTSAGRLFDAVAALLGICHTNHFEGQAGMAVEFAAAGSAANGAEFSYNLNPSENGTGTLEIDWAPMLEELASARVAGIPVPTLAMSFHKTLARIIVDVARHFGIRSIALTGGCFQNAVLTDLTHDALKAARFEPLLHHRLPPNDNAIAAGQALAVLWGMGTRD
jgi:hydrogenase maturation protein HypF